MDSSIHSPQLIDISTDNITRNNPTNKLDHPIGNPRNLESQLVLVQLECLPLTETHTVDREKCIGVPVSISDFSARFFDFPSSGSIDNH